MPISKRVRQFLVDTYLSYLQQGFETGDFTPIYEFLSDDCEFCSYPEEYILDKKSDVVGWLSGLGNEIANGRASYDVVIGPIEPFHVNGYLVDNFEKVGLYDKTCETIFYIKVSQSGMIQSIGFWKPLVFEVPIDEGEK